MEVLTEYNIIVFEFYPNDWGCIVGFITNCMAIGIESTLTAFRYIFRLRKCTAILVFGWVTFQHMRGFFLVKGLKDSMKFFRKDIIFLYHVDS